ncbi:MAG TPA: LysR family transcriptional regulator [Devosiaceae bacterium]|jgi:DNA-binding transcriptional LysR family regulator
MAGPGLFELNAVVAVATHRSFRKAAADLGMSASALSHAIAALEQRLGVRLFNRTTRSVSLSEAGEQFLGRVRPALREIAEAMDSVNAFRNTPAGTLRLNTSDGAAILVMPMILAFLARYPDMQVDLITEGRFVDIVADGFDAGIRTADAVPQDMIAVPCTGALRFVLAGSPGYFERHPRPLSPADLPSHVCIRTRIPGGGVHYNWDFEKHGEAVEFEPRGPLSLDNHHLMIEAALGGIGLIWITEGFAAPHISDGRLVQVLADWTPAWPGLALYYPGHRHVPAGLRAFVALVREMHKAA